MAIIFEDASVCPICRKVLNKVKPYLIFPPLISNSLDLMYIFSDSGVHEECLTQHKFGTEARNFKSKYDEMLANIKLMVADENGEIKIHPKNILSFGLLTSDKTEELFLFNFLILNKENISTWKDRERFIRLVSKFINDGKWASAGNFNYLQYLIDEIFS